MEIKLNTKLRLENSALGTYELTVNEDNAHTSCQIPKELGIEKLIGLCLYINAQDEGEVAWVVTSVTTDTEDGVKSFNLMSGNTTISVYYPATGTLVVPI